jgi:hypothetical protein
MSEQTLPEQPLLPTVEAQEGIDSSTGVLADNDPIAEEPSAEAVAAGYMPAESVPVDPVVASEDSLRERRGLRRLGATIMAAGTFALAACGVQHEGSAQEHSPTTTASAMPSAEHGSDYVFKLPDMTPVQKAQYAQMAETSGHIITDIQNVLASPYVHSQVTPDDISNRQIVAGPDGSTGNADDPEHAVRAFVKRGYDPARDKQYVNFGVERVEHGNEGANSIITDTVTVKVELNMDDKLAAEPLSIANLQDFIPTDQNRKSVQLWGIQVNRELWRENSHRQFVDGETYDVQILDPSNKGTQQDPFTGLIPDEMAQRKGTFDPADQFGGADQRFAADASAAMGAVKKGLSREGFVA